MKDKHMKTLTQHIEEKLKINKDYSNPKIVAKNKKDLERIIHERLKDSPHVLDLNDVDVSNVTDFCELFGKCSGVYEIHIEDWDVSHIEDMSFMFYECYDLRSIDLSNWTPGKRLWDLNHMFCDCDSLEEIKLFDCDWNNKRTDYMFKNCIRSAIPDEWYDYYANGCKN